MIILFQFGFGYCFGGCVYVVCVRRGLVNWHRSWGSGEFRLPGSACFSFSCILFDPYVYTYPYLIIPHKFKWVEIL